MGDCKDPEHCRDQHLCKLVKHGEFEQVKKFAKDAVFICKKCGRAAREQRNLCDPARL